MAKKILSVDNILDLFFHVLGSERMLIVPLFNFEYLEGVPININITPSQMGA